MMHLREAIRSGLTELSKRKRHNKKEETGDGLMQSLVSCCESYSIVSDFSPLSLHSTMHKMLLVLCSILIGKGGRTLEAMQLLIKNSILNQTGFKINVILDVEDYKEKNNRHLEFNVKKIAKEVRRTGVDAKVDPMN